MSNKETKMRNKKTLTALAAVIVLTAGFAGAAEIKFTVADTEAVAQNSLFTPELMKAAAPMVASPAPVASMAGAPAIAPARPISFVPAPDFGGAFRSGRFEKGAFTTSLIAMTVLNVADYITTRQALKYSGLVEGNPLMKPFVKNAAVFAAVKAGTTILSVWGMKSLFKRDKTTAWVLTTVSNFLLSYVVANNMRMIRRVQPR
jgi:hypothetical protein